LEEESTQTYHVHRCFLACGPHKSEYFAKVFQNSDSFREAESSTSHIELHPLAANAFPFFLDYLYAPENPLEISLETVTALYYLGEYFDVSHLRWEATQFCKQKLSLGNVDILYEHATIFQNEAFLGIISRFLGRNIMTVDTGASILTVSTPQLWFNVLNDTDLENHARANT
jgi:hypothetical protein